MCRKSVLTKVSVISVLLACMEAVSEINFQLSAGGISSFSLLESDTCFSIEVILSSKQQVNNNNK